MQRTQQTNFELIRMQLSRFGLNPSDWKIEIGANKRKLDVISIRDKEVYFHAKLKVASQYFLLQELSLAI